jgi:hypothetical protein
MWRSNCPCVDVLGHTARVVAGVVGAGVLV